MKLLGWMHQKLHRHRKEQWTNLDEPTGSFAQSWQPKGNSPTLLNKNKETGWAEEMLKAQSHDDEPFHGFLMIGTLGSEPSTPTFSMSFQDMTDKDMNIAANEVEFINSEVEKILSAEAKEVSDESSPRSSQVSDITLSNTQLNEADSDGFPLEKYLFGNAAELLLNALKKEKKPPEKHLIKFSSCENSVRKYDSPDKLQKRSYAMHLMKNVLKKLIHSAAMRCTSGSNGTETKSGAVKRKHPKVLKQKFFHKKVHPAEGFIVGKQYKLEKKEETTKVTDSSNIPWTEDGHREKTRSRHNMATLIKEICSSEPSSGSINRNGTREKRERWITTDDDYLVLELQNGYAQKSRSFHQSKMVHNYATK